MSLTWKESRPWLVRLWFCLAIGSVKLNYMSRYAQNTVTNFTHWAQDCNMPMQRSNCGKNYNAHLVYYYQEHVILALCSRHETAEVESWRYLADRAATRFHKTCHISSCMSCITKESTSREWWFIGVTEEWSIIHFSVWHTSGEAGNVALCAEHRQSLTSYVEW